MAVAFCCGLLNLFVMSDYDNGTAIAVAGINSLGTSIGAIKKVKDAKKLLDYQMDWQEKMYDKQVATNRANWQMENEYNSPSNQRRLLEQAGYNPGLMAGDLEGVSTGSTIDNGVMPNSPAFTDMPDVIGSAVGSATNAFVALTNQNVQRKMADASMVEALSQERNAFTNEKNSFTNRGYLGSVAAKTDTENDLAKIDKEFRFEYLASKVSEIQAHDYSLRAQAEVQRQIGIFLPQEKSLEFGKLLSETDLNLERAKTEKHNQSYIDAKRGEALASAYALGAQARRSETLLPGDKEQQDIHTANMYAGQSDDYQTRRDIAPTSVTTSDNSSVKGPLGVGYSAGRSSTTTHPSYLKGNSKRGILPDMVSAYVSGYQGKPMPKYK